MGGRTTGAKHRRPGCSPVTFVIFAWGATEMIGESASEGSLADVPDSSRDTGDGHVGRGEEFRGGRHSPSDEIGVRGFADHLGEPGGEGRS